jgi:hypothetical protein
MGEARKAMYLEGNSVEWATPVLYLRASNAYIFGIPEPENKAIADNFNLESRKMQQEKASVEQQDDTSHQNVIKAQPGIFPQEDNQNRSEAVSTDIILPGKWLFVNDLQEELTLELIPSGTLNNTGTFTASLYYKRSRSWLDEVIEGKWSYDPAKDRLSLSGMFVDYGERFSLSLVIGRGNAGFFTAKDSKGGRFSMIAITGEFQPIGKWLITYEMNGPSELSIEFLPSEPTNPTGGEFVATENYKEAKRWVAEDIFGQWTYNPAKKRLTLSGKYADSGSRFSITPYINRWERNHFSAKDHDGIEFSLMRVG